MDVADIIQSRRQSRTEFIPLGKSVRLRLVFPFINRPLDRLVIRLAASRLSDGAPPDARAREAEALLDREDFFGESVKPPTEVEFDDTGGFRFRSAFESPWASNNEVVGRLIPGGKDWRSLPSVILIHGYNADLAYLKAMPRWAERLVWRGINGVLLELPFHLQRRPIRTSSAGDFLSADLLSVAQATHQSMLDLRALLRWLKVEGAPAVGLWGNSLGGWLEGLLVANSDEIDCAAFLTPLSRMDRALSELEFAVQVRRSVESSGFNASRLSLEEFRPRLSPEQMLFLVGRDDAFIPLETMRSLAKAWGGAEVRVFPNGHISILFSEEVADQTAEWFRDRM